MLQLVVKLAVIAIERSHFEGVNCPRFNWGRILVCRNENRNVIRRIKHTRYHREFVNIGLYIGYTRDKIINSINAYTQMQFSNFL